MGINFSLCSLPLLSLFNKINQLFIQLEQKQVLFKTAKLIYWKINRCICYWSINIRFNTFRVNIDFRTWLKRLDSSSHRLSPPTRWHRKCLCEKNVFCSTITKVSLHVKRWGKYGMSWGLLNIYLYKYYSIEVRGIVLTYLKFHSTMLFSLKYW